ncbi:MAG: hypothetical protein LC649_09480 [Bacteroidales bacterium]|nr:hypothetical protein [Bacteroidales bacterium]
MKRIVTVCLVLICLMPMIRAQDYRTGIGLRSGFANGLTIKHFTHEKNALEFLVASRWRGVELTVLYEIHNEAFNTQGLKWYYGFGGHVGFYDGDYTNKYWGDPGTNYTVVGIDGILGLEYSFSEVPLNLGIDWKPALNFIGYSGFWADGGALSIRYVF